MAQNQENNAWQKGSFKLFLTNPETQKKTLRVAPLGRSSPAPLGRSVTNGDNYRFQRVNSNVSSPNKTPQQIYNQAQDNSYLLSQGEIPTLDEIKAIYKENVKLGEDIDPDRLKILIKQLFQNQRRDLHPNWWDETKKIIRNKSEKQGHHDK